MFLRHGRSSLIVFESLRNSAGANPSTLFSLSSRYQVLGRGLSLRGTSRTQQTLYDIRTRITCVKTRSFQTLKTDQTAHRHESSAGILLVANLSLISPAGSNKRIHKDLSQMKGDTGNRNQPLQFERNYRFRQERQDRHRHRQGFLAGH